MREERVDVGGAHLWTARSGSGRPLMLCAGGPGCCDYYDPVAPLIEAAAEVLRHEQRGCGRSDAGATYDLATTLADLDALRAHFGFERWSVGGHSWGADLALAYALEFPGRVDALLYVCGKGIHDDRSWHATYHEGRGTEREPDYAFPPNREVNAQLNADWKRYLKRPDLLARIAALDVPALCMAAGRDIRPHWPIEQLANLLPRARFALLPDAAHVPWLTHAPEFSKVVREFLEAA